MLAECARPSVLLPCLLLALLAAPSVGYMLPSYESKLGEDYQPLQTLKFFASLGADEQKYGPMSNYLLGPSYAASMAYWWLVGSFTKPSGDFPYGLADPLQQLSWLLWHGRVLFMAIFLGLSAFALRRLRVLTPDTTAIALAFTLLVATDFAAVGMVANTRPDGPMYAFLLASMALYAEIAVSGLSRARGIVLSVFAVLAISSKELAGTVYLLPYLGLGARGFSETRGDPAARREFLRTALFSVAAGVGTYLLLNVAYNPRTWLWRMQHWLVEEGTDSAVWGGVASGNLSRLGFLVEVGRSFLNTLGPGGLPVTAVALAALLTVRPPRWLLLLLPFFSILGFGLLPLGYVGDRFHAAAVITLVPPVALGLALLLERSRGGASRRAVVAALAVAVVLNAWFATFEWHRLEGLQERVVERSLVELPIGERSVNLLSPSPLIAGKSRLDWLGYRVDSRSLQEIIDAPPAERPDRIYAWKGVLGFVNAARDLPARAELLRDAGFDVARWHGFEALGYRELAVIQTPTPWWFPFDWMPAVRWWSERNPVLVYERAP